MKKKKVNITLRDDTRERIEQFGYENNIPGGLSGALEFIAWHVLKVKNSQLKGQITIDIKDK